MRISRQCMIALILITFLITTTACSRLPEHNEIETMQPIEYNENADNNDQYFTSINSLGVLGPNPVDITYPTMKHLMYLYIFDQHGYGSPNHSLLLDIKYSKAYYTTSGDFFIGGYSLSNYTKVDLSQTDIETITEFSTVQGILDWEDNSHSNVGETQWFITLYFDNGSYFQTSGESYTDEYKELENDIWPLLSEKTGQELWWMRGRP